jgi:predicted PurR-regulated permease PerM
VITSQKKADRPPDTVQRAEEPRAATEGERARGRQEPDLTRLTRPLGTPFGALIIAGVGLLVLGILYTLYFARPVLLPVVLAVLLAYLLRPAVRTLSRTGLPTPIAAGFVLAMLVLVTGYGTSRLAGPAADWISNAPGNLRTAERKLRGLKKPVEAVNRATEEIEKITDVDNGREPPEVQVAETPLAKTVLGQTRVFFAGAVITLFLLYFLLAAGDLLLRQLVRVLPRFHQRRTAVIISRRTERDLSTFLFTMGMINIGLGCAIGLGMHLLGMPNPILWGVMAAFLNFIPYLGPLVGVAIVSLVAVVSFDSTAHILAAPLVYFGLNAIEGSLVTPFIMGHRLKLNPIFILLSLTFWGWLWGIPGALLAVPLLATFKIICNNIELLAPVGEFLGANNIWGRR